MTIQYEALLGHLFMVGGRSISTPPPGAAYQVAPKRVHRSREQDTLFVLITPAGQTNVTADFYEKMAKLALDSYFNSRLGVTGALREAAASLNQHVQKLNQQQASDYRAGALLLAKRGDAVYLLRTGTTLCVARLNGVYTVFPNDPDMLNMLPLGSRSEPLVEFIHYSLSPGDLFVLGDGGIAALSDSFLQEAMRVNEIEAVLEKLEGGIERQAFATVIQFVDSSGQSAPAPIPPQPEPIAPPLAPSPALDELTVVSQSTVNLTDTDLAAPDVVTTASPEIPTPQIVDASPAAEIPEPEVITESVPEAAFENKGKQPRATGEVKAPKKRQNLLQVIMIALLLILSNLFRSLSNGLSAILDRLLPEPEDSPRQRLIPMNIVALVAVIVPAIVGVAVVGFAISNRDTTVYEELRAEAMAALNDAQVLEGSSSANPVDKRNAWIDARHWAELARRENPQSNEMRQIILDAQSFIDRYDKITRASVTPMRTYEENGDLRGPIMSPGGLDIYVLDRNRSQVYRDQLDGSGQRISEASDTPVIARARPVNQYIVSNIVDIEWLTEGGAATRNALVALDDNGLLISYHGTFGLSALELIRPPEWSRPEAIALWGANFYVLDAGANQVWRYRPADGFYTAAPEEYFTGSSRPNLSAAVDFGIDEDGAIYILFSDGTISKYVGGEPSLFEINEADAPVDGIRDGHALFVSIDPRSYALFLADQANDAIYQISLGGQVNTGYRPDDLLSRVFDEVSGVFVDVQRSNIYVLSGNSLYRIPGR